jgi:hypothetical protein
MTQTEITEKIKEVLTKMYKLTVEELHKEVGSKLPILQLHKALKILEKGNFIEIETNESGKFYSLVKEEGIEGIDKPLKETPAKEQTVLVKLNQTGRDNTKYLFNGVEHNKGRLALAIVKEYAKKKVSYKKLLEVFPVDLTPPYGFVKPLDEALEIGKKRPRFFTKEDEQIKLSDGLYCVSNQLTKERISELIRIAEEQLGYKIKPC